MEDYNLIRLITEIIDEDNQQGVLSESMKYHLSNRIPIRESVFRIHSKSYLSLFREARRLYRDGSVSFDEEDSFSFGFTNHKIDRKYYDNYDSNEDPHESQIHQFKLEKTGLNKYFYDKTGMNVKHIIYDNSKG